MTLSLTVPDVHRIVLHDRQEQEASSDDKQRLVNVWRRRYYKFSWRPELWEENVILFLLENSREKGKQGPRFEASGSSVTGSRRFPEKIPSNAPVQIHCLFPFSFLFWGLRTGAGQPQVPQDQRSGFFTRPQDFTETEAFPFPLI